MEAFPPDIEKSLFKAVGAYLRVTPANELPPRVRPFAGFTESAMSRHKKEVLSLLDDDAQRALIEEWLREDKPKLGKTDASNLTVALARAEGWVDELKGRSKSAGDRTEERPDPSAKLTSDLERERSKLKKAKDELQRSRAEFEVALKKESARSERLRAELEAALVELTSHDVARVAAERIASSAAARAEREVRRARKEADTATKQRDTLRLELKEVRKDLRATKAKLTSLESKATVIPEPTKKRTKPKQPTAPRSRSPLPVPKGRFEDAPETLDEWLHPGVLLIVDGYNVTKAERGFGELKLEVQRDRLIKEAEQLARRKKVAGTIVFDGSEVPPGTSRSRRGPVRVEFSAPDEIADDHIVALIEGLPPDPIVLVTNDRELQDRARAHGATIARSDQLLALIRP